MRCGFSLPHGSEGMFLMLCLLATSQLLNEALQYQETTLEYSHPLFTIYANHSFMTLLWLSRRMSIGEYKTRWREIFFHGKGRQWSPKLSVLMVVTLAFVYFVPNVAWAMAMEVSEISQFTLILQTMSVWVLLFQSIQRKRCPHILEFIAVVCSVSGVILMTLGEHGDENEKEDSLESGIATSGTVLAVLCTIGYSLYQVFFATYFSEDDDTSDIAYVLAAMGFANMVLFWPVPFFMPELLGFPSFVWPSSARQCGVVLLVATLSIMTNVLYMVLLAVTSPLFVTLGMLLLIPISSVADLIWEPERISELNTSSTWSWTSVMASFLITLGILILIREQRRARRHAMSTGTSEEGIEIAVTYEPVRQHEVDGDGDRNGDHVGE